jgi:hypothetical protein
MDPQRDGMGKHFGDLAFAKAISWNRTQNSDPTKGESGEESFKNGAVASADPESYFGVAKVRCVRDE